MRSIEQDQQSDGARGLIEQAARSWTGPSPLASQSRWAGGAVRGAWRATRMVTAAAAFAAIVFASVTAVAAAVAPGSVAPVANLVSHVLRNEPLPDAVATPSVVPTPVVTAGVTKSASQAPGPKSAEAAGPAEYAKDSSHRTGSGWGEADRGSEFGSAANQRPHRGGGSPAPDWGQAHD